MAEEDKVTSEVDGDDEKHTVSLLFGMRPAVLPPSVADQLLALSQVLLAAPVK